MQEKHQLTRLDVVLVSLGTPERLDVPAIRQFLRRFLSDKRVIEAPRAIWYPVLYGLILPFRPRRLTSAYAQIWKAYGDSPLRVIAQQQAQSLQLQLDAHPLLQNTKTEVHDVMLYDTNNVTKKMKTLAKKHADLSDGQSKVIILPLYPQYSATTTAAVYDQVFSAFASTRNIPAHYIVKNYYAHKAYRDALSASVESFWKEHQTGDHLLMSFHGIPKEYVDKGDPYFQECVKTAQNLQADLLLNDTRCSYSFQSRLGPKQWLQPYTDETVKKLAQQGIKVLDVVCPSFSADCLETLEEIALEAGDIFREYGGENLRLIPSLNDQAMHIKLFEKIVLESI